MNSLKKYFPFVFLLLPAAFILLPWFNNMVLISEEYRTIAANGLFVMFEEHGRIAIIYFLCILVQAASIKNKDWLLPIFTNSILIGVLICFPFFVAPTAKIIDLTDYYNIGFYLSTISLLTNIFFNIKSALSTKSHKKI